MPTTEAKEHARQAQRAVALEKLAGGVAHDLNNLLTAVFSFSRFVMEDLTERDPSYADMQEIMKAATRAHGLTSQLLSFVRQHPGEPKVFAPNDALENLKKMLRRLVREDVGLSMKLDARGGLIFMDLFDFEQVVVNLVVHAVGAWPNAGSVHVETQLVTADDGNKVLVLVSRSTSEKPAREHDTIGLPLSACDTIVNEAGGSLTTEQTTDGTAIIRMTLPCTKRPAENTSALEDALPGGKETILLVEDNEQVRRVTWRILSQLGYHVLGAQNGGEALMISEDERTPIDLLVTDAVMPGMGGRELAVAMRKLHPEMRTLYVSGYAPGALKEIGAIAEDATLLAKPFSPENFARKVRTVLDTAIATAQ
jgi:CheY-like chemotaxis protein